MYPDIEQELKELLKGEDVDFMIHYNRLQLLIIRKVKDRRLRKAMFEETEAFRHGVLKHLTQLKATSDRLAT
jgi:hypothetical protein